MLLGFINCTCHYDDVIMGAMAAQITSLTIVYSTVYSVADQRKHQSSASLAFVRGIHRGPVNSPHKWPGPRKMVPFDDVIMVIPLSVYTTGGEECIFPHPFDNNHQESNQCITASNSGRNFFVGLHTPYCYTAMNSDDTQQETEECACKIQHIGGNTLVIGHRV